MSPVSSTPSPSARPAPVTDRPALEVAAQADQLELLPDLEPVARPQLDAVARAHDPLAVGLVEQDPRVERVRPVDHARVVVRVRDRDRVDRPVRGHRARRLRPWRGHAVPQQPAGRERPLTDREARLHRQAEQPGLLLGDGRSSGRRRAPRPPPTAGRRRHVLALVGADRADVGRGRRRAGTGRRRWRRRASSANDRARRRPPGAAYAAGVRAPALVAACLALAALSLVLPWALAFDPYAWLVWGRELAHGTLDTSAGPSWKPGPVLVTTPLSVLGDVAAPGWLVIARTGARLAVAGAAALAWRLGAGRLAARRARRFVRRAEPVVVVQRRPGQLGGLPGRRGPVGRRRAPRGPPAPRAARPPRRLAAATRGVAVPRSLRPVGGAGGRRARGRRSPRASRRSGCCGSCRGPLGGGGAASAAQGTPSAGSAALADVPFLAVLQDAVELLTVPAAVALVALALRRPARPVVLLGAAAAAYVADRRGDDPGGLRRQPALPRPRRRPRASARRDGRRAPRAPPRRGGGGGHPRRPRRPDPRRGRPGRHPSRASPRCPSPHAASSARACRSGPRWRGSSTGRFRASTGRRGRPPRCCGRAPYAGGPPEPRVGAPFADDRDRAPLGARRGLPGAQAGAASGPMTRIAWRSR